MKNIEKYRKLLPELGLDGVLLTGRVNRRYCAQYDIMEAIALVTPTESRYFTDSRYIEAAEKNLPDFTVEMVDKDHSFAMLLRKAVEELGIRELGFEEECLTVSEFSEFDQALGVKLVPCQKHLDALRVVKEDWELERMRKAQRITDQAFSEILTKIRPGMTEMEVRAELIYCLYKNGADGLAFDPIVVSGPNTSMPHGVPGERRLQDGDFITMDFGAAVDGYCSDMTRTVALGYATEEMKKVYEIVLEAQKAGIAAAKAGVPGNAIDGAARSVIEKAGYGAFFGHGFGHCLGLMIHEPPNCNPKNDQLMPAGCVTSAEPGIYLPDRFGVRIEDVLILREDGNEDITASPRELIIV
ncbi:MAG: aminopeptidase P family protein [Oscillospiraceae bacterium]|nr:aminopeptidase P family protein [Oscillospiraceae bacterium]